MKFAALISIVLTLSVSANAYVFDNNVPADVKEQTIKDLEFISSIEASATSSLHKDIFGEVSGSTYKEFFESRVRSIGMNSCGGGNAVACVYPMMPTKIWFSPNYVKFKHPQISRLMIVYHEARHTETKNGNWMHATCPRPFLDENGEDMKSIWTGALLEGQAACDSTPAGSYGSSMIMLKNISKFCTSCNEKVKMDAGIYADDQFGRVTDAGARKAILEDLY